MFAKTLLSRLRPTRDGDDATTDASEDEVSADTLYARAMAILEAAPEDEEGGDENDPRAQALELLETAAEEGHEGALREAFEMRRQGPFENVEQAAEWASALTETDPSYHNIAAVWPMKANRHHEALAHLAKGVAHGDPWAYRNLAMEVLYRRCHTIDPNGAMALLRRAAEMGNDDAMMQLAKILEPKHPDEALALYRHAAAAGNLEAAQYLAERGEAIEEAARDLLRRAAGDGDTRSAGALALAERGTPVETQEVARSADADALAVVLGEIDALNGLHEVKTNVRRLVNAVKVIAMRRTAGLETPAPTLHLALTGNPGTGKTTLARLMARLYHALGLLPEAKTIEADRSQMVGEYTGHTAARTAKLVESAIGGVLFLDEADQLAGGQYDSFGAEAAGQLVKMMEDRRGEFAVIVATHPDGMQRFLAINPGLSSRFPTVFRLPDPDLDGLLAIFRALAAREGYRLAPGVEDELRVRIRKAWTRRGAGWGNGREVRNIFEAARWQAWERLAALETADAETLSTIRPEDVAEPRAVVFRPEMVPPPEAPVVDLRMPDGPVALKALVADQPTDRLTATIAGDALIVRNRSSGRLIATVRGRDSEHLRTGLADVLPGVLVGLGG